METVQLFLVVLLPSLLLGQWSPDSTLNLTICDLSGEQVLPKIVPTSDGGCFISWFDTRSGSYCVYLQRLDYQGVPQLGEDGLPVSDQPQASWIVDYSMAVDGSDNAVLAFSDERNGSGELDVSVYKVSSTGEFLWGEDGICLSDLSVPGFEPNPVVAVTDLGNCVFAWGKSEDTDYLIFQKLSPSGEKLWGDNGIVFSSASADLSSPGIIPSGQDSVIVLWKSSTGSYPMTVTHLYADMLDVNGEGTWSDSPVLVYNTGAITPWTFPGIIEDGSDGAVCFWYDSPTMNSFDVWVQHLDSQGMNLFPFNGAQASTFSADRLHMSPSAVINSSGDCFAFWVESNANQNMYGVYGQKFSATGDRLWTDSGLELLPLGSEQTAFVDAQVAGDGIFVSYLVNSSNTSLKVLKLGFDGTVLWGPVSISAGSLGGKDDPVVCPGYDGGAYYTWADFRGDGGVYAQNIQADGSMGQYLGVEPGSGAGFLKVTPNPSRGAVSFVLGGAAGETAIVRIYDLSGRLVDSVGTVLGSEGATLAWNRGGSVPPGVYLVRMENGSRVLLSRMILL